MEDKPRKTILIIGDWFIDENWLVSKQKIYRSSHTGDIHFIARHNEIDRRIISLCGATEILMVLKLYFDNPNRKEFNNQFRFIVFGTWNSEDNDLMDCILCDEYKENKLLTPYTLVSLKEIKYRGTDNDKKKLCPYKDGELCKSELELKNLSKKGKKVSTNRYIRCYEGFGGDIPHLLYRFDWHLPIKDDILNYELIDEVLRKFEIDAIIIEDHGLGVINETSIKKLARNVNKKALWFIRTKIDNPSWLKILNKEQIKPSLIVTDFKLANYKKGERRWWYGIELGRAALELLGEMTGEPTYIHGKINKNLDLLKSERAAVLLDNNIVFAKEHQYCCGIHRPPGEKQILNIGRTTIFFSALIAQSMKNLINDKSNENFHKICFKALTCAYEWSKTASNSWNNEEELYFYGNYKNALDKLDENVVSLSKKEIVEKRDYNNLWEMWNQSSQDLGLVNSNKQEVLQLWRGEGTLPDYICIGGPKRDAINRLMSSIAAFKNDKSPKYPLSCVLTASPGWGKSYLANCLAKYFNMEFLGFSIAQMSTTRDLVNCFATISSVQSRSRKKTLVFIDEVNAEIEGNSVMNLLLSPLWEGRFIIDGRSYRLDPALWIFASTDRMETIAGRSKGSDFASRLNGPIIELDLLGAGGYLASAIRSVRKSITEMADAGINIYKDVYKLRGYKTFKKDKSAILKTEQVYLMTSLLGSHWGPISEIQKCVLQLFHDILPVNGVRSLEVFASSLEEVTGGKIVVSNIPKIEKNAVLMRHIIPPEEWLDEVYRKKIAISPSVPIEIIIK